MRARAAGLLGPALVVVLCAGCTCGGSRARRDRGGPAVVVVDPNEADRPRPVAEVEPNDSRTTAQILPAERPVEGTLRQQDDKGPRRADTDWYRVQAPADGGEQVLQVSVSGVKDLDLVLEAFDEAGRRLVRVNNSGQGEGELLVNLTVMPAVTTFLRVREAKGIASAGHSYRIDYKLRAREEGEEREPNWKAELATPLALDDEAVGYLGWHTDNDWYQVMTGATGPGTRLRVEFDGVDDVPANLSVWLAGQKVQERWGRSGQSILLANLKVAGTVGIKEPPPLNIVVRTSYHANVETRYSLRVLSSVPPMATEAEPNDLATEATPLAPGSTIAGILADTKDHDLYRVSVGQPTFLRATAVPPMGLDLALALVDSAGTVLVEADEGKDREAETLPALWVKPPGALLRARAPRHSAVSGVSSYHIKVEPVTLQPGQGLEIEPNNVTAAATPWPDPGAGSGAAQVMLGFIHPRHDVDHFLVQADGGNLTIAVTSVPKLSFKLELLDPAGATTVGVGSSPGAGLGASLTVNTSSAGRYILKVTETGGSTDAQQAYQLRMTRDTP